MIQPQQAPPIGATSNDGAWQWNGSQWTPRYPVAVVTSAPVALAPIMPRTKTTAILLAIFLGFWGFLYTYKRDSVWFWLSLVGFLFPPLAIITLVAWPVAIIQACTRSDDFYARFPYGA